MGNGCDTSLGRNMCQMWWEEVMWKAGTRVDRVFGLDGAFTPPFQTTSHMGCDI